MAESKKNSTKLIKNKDKAAEDKKAKKIKKLKKEKRKSEKKKSGKDESPVSCKINKDCPGKE